ncbi:enoyl-CoA hydratase-related protein [Fictibacillus enclensis]|uniref:enoyl-CoA hydratase/isomerase family protein n=1 Tax=Fictibacillus enclensis TaxID=1017270 RepID=UPI0025A04D3C|nr:enoyl-CoA hydratase-related protein [Fictibacillus enclensis]MDM5338556.1 enoyl-CoA hydratase-related protein [Fictibacillus enclensis]
MTEYRNIELVQKDQLGFIIIDRPELRNALDKETLNEMTKALEDFRQDQSVGCVIFTGKGEKSFAAGADITQLKEKTMLDALDSGGMQTVYNLIESYEKPTIAMINGYALGGGFELAMACDIRIASSNAKVGLPELNLSIIPGAGGTQRLARLVGKGKALEMILLGKIIDAAEAKQIGLISEVTSAEDLERKAEKIGMKILSKGPLAVKLAKIVVHSGTEVDMKTGLLIEKLAQAILFSSEDKGEGTKAFLEKRQPQFSGK